MPPHYNARRQFDRPVPSLSASPATGATDTASNASTSAEDDHESSDNEELVETNNGAENNEENEPLESAQSTDADDTASGNIVAIDETTTDVTEHTDNLAESHDSDVNDDEANNNDGNTETDTNVSQSSRDTEIDAKHVLAPVNMDSDDEAAIENIFGDQEKSVEANDNSDSSSVDLIAKISLGCGEAAEVKDGKIIVTRKMDDGLEMAYTYGETPKPLAPLYAIKINDSISGNIPFKNNATKDRGYFIKIDNQFKEINMASLLVNGLQCINNGENRKQPGLDKAFVKALIIGLCTKKAIENGEQIHKNLLVFMKGLNIFVNSLL